MLKFQSPCTQSLSQQHNLRYRHPWTWPSIRKNTTKIHTAVLILWISSIDAQTTTTLFKSPNSREKYTTKNHTLPHIADSHHRVKYYIRDRLANKISIINSAIRKSCVGSFSLSKQHVHHTREREQLGRPTSATIISIDTQTNSQDDSSSSTFGRGSKSRLYLTARNDMS